MASFPLAMPFFAFIDVALKPQHQLSRMVSSPLMKYLTSVSSYILFLSLLIYSAFQPMRHFLSFSVVGEFLGVCVLFTLDVSLQPFYFYSESKAEDVHE